MLRDRLVERNAPDLSAPFSDSQECGYEDEHHEIALIMNEIEASHLVPFQEYKHRSFQEIIIKPKDGQAITTKQIAKQEGTSNQSPEKLDTRTVEELDAEFHRQMEISEVILNLALHLTSSSQTQERLHFPLDGVPNVTIPEE